METGKLDRTAFKAQTAEEAADHVSYYKIFSPTERLKTANYLNSVAYHYPESSPPRVDKTIFSVRARG